MIANDNFESWMLAMYRVGVLESTLKLAGVSFPSREQTDAWYRDHLAKAEAHLEEQLRASVAAGDRLHPSDVVVTTREGA